MYSIFCHFDLEEQDDLLQRYFQNKREKLVIKTESKKEIINMLVDSNKKSNQDIITQSENQRVNSTGVIISLVL